MNGEELLGIECFGVAVPTRLAEPLRIRSVASQMSDVVTAAMSHPRMIPPRTSVSQRSRTSSKNSCGERPLSSILGGGVVGS